MDGPFSKAQQRRRPNPALTKSILDIFADLCYIFLSYYKKSGPTKLITLFMDGPFGKAQQRRRPNPALTAAAVCARAVCTVL